MSELSKDYISSLKNMYLGKCTSNPNAKEASTWFVLYTMYDDLLKKMNECKAKDEPNEH